MQVKQTQVIRLANVLGMGIDNKQHQIAIHDAITNVKAADDFVEYCRTNKDGIDFSNRLDKLETLYTRYKNTIDDIPTLVLEKFCKRIAEKFKEAIQVLRDNEEYLSKDLSKFTNHGEQHFTNKEIELLNEAGGLNKLISLHEQHTLYDTLYNESVKKTIDTRKYEALSDGQKQTKHLIENAIKGE